MIKSILEFIALCFAVVIELIGMAFSGNDYSSKETEIRMQYLIDNQAIYEEVAKNIYSYKKAGGFVDISKADKTNYKKIKHTVKDSTYISIYENNNYTVNFDLYGSTHGFGQCEIIYIDKDAEATLKRKYYDNIEWDEKRNCYVVFNAANYHEIMKVTDHLYFDQEAFYNNEAFRRKE